MEICNELNCLLLTNGPLSKIKQVRITNRFEMGDKMFDVRNWGKYPIK